MRQTAVVDRVPRTLIFQYTVNDPFPLPLLILGMTRYAQRAACRI